MQINSPLQGDDWPKISLLEGLTFLSAWTLPASSGHTFYPSGPGTKDREQKSLSMDRQLPCLEHICPSLWVKGRPGKQVKRR